MMRPEALRPPEIPEKSLGRITTMPLTRFALHRELHHEPCISAPFPHSSASSCFVQASGSKQAVGMLLKHV